MKIECAGGGKQHLASHVLRRRAAITARDHLPAGTDLERESRPRVHETEREPRRRRRRSREDGQDGATGFWNGAPESPEKTERPVLDGRLRALPLGARVARARVGGRSPRHKPPGMPVACPARIVLPPSRRACGPAASGRHGESLETKIALRLSPVASLLRFESGSFGPLR